MSITAPAAPVFLSKHVALPAEKLQMPGPRASWGPVVAPSTASMAQQMIVPHPQSPTPVDGWRLPFPASEFIAMLLQFVIWPVYVVWPELAPPFGPLGRLYAFQTPSSGGGDIPFISSLCMISVRDASVCCW